MVIYELQVWDKNKGKYIVTWTGQNFVRAQIMAAKPYNNHSWMGKKRILSIDTQVLMIIPHVRKRK